MITIRKLLYFSNHQVKRTTRLACIIIPAELIVIVSQNIKLIKKQKAAEQTQKKSFKNVVRDDYFAGRPFRAPNYSISAHLHRNNTYSHYLKFKSSFPRNISQGTLCCIYNTYIYTTLLLFIFVFFFWRRIQKFVHQCDISAVAIHF